MTQTGLTKVGKAADTLAYLMQRELGVVVSAHDLTAFIRNEWDVIHTLAHAIHNSDPEHKELSVG